MPAGAVAGQPKAESAVLQGAYAGHRGPLFDLAVRCALLSVATLGLYRFWERTRVRRFIWSASRPGGDPFEYTGTGLEKLTGFFLAVLVLAIGLGMIQLLLFFAGLSVFSQAGGAAEAGSHLFLAQGSLLLFLPLLFFAQYRARRYKLARTRWRGIRFALDPGAWGYTWRGCLCLLATVLSAGLLWPLMSFTLERFRTDRTWFGDARLTQGGRWVMLLPSLRHMIAGPVLVLLALAGDSVALIVGAVLVGLPCTLAGLLFYRVDSFRRLTAAKRLILPDGTVAPLRLTSGLRTGRVLRHLLLGGLLVALLGGIGTGLFGAALASLAEFGGEGTSLTGLGPLDLLVSLLGLLALLGVYGSLTLVFITQPIAAEVVSTARAENAGFLTGIRQRDRDPMADADGFASALDFGGPF